MRLRKVFTIFTVIILIIPSLLVSADSNEGMKKEEQIHDDGVFSSKDEVIYGTLTATGNSEEMYIVNTFDVKKAGVINDYGSYESVKNLTDLSEIKKEGNKIEFLAPKGKFYYQGNVNQAPLPWNIDISYILDGNEIAPENLPGQDGHVQIQIETSQNEKVNDAFFENYILQISLTLDPEIYNNIKAEDGMIANAGKHKQVTFTVMPEKEEKLQLEADVTNFELDGIDITAVPSFMSIDAPNTEEMTGDMKSLTDAISEINHGVFELKNGVNELNSGVTNLSNGSSQYKTGLSELNAGSSEIVTASESIDTALATINSSLSEDGDDVDLSQLEELQVGLEEIASGMTETADGILAFSTGYKTLGEAIESIPSANLTEQEIGELYASNADAKVIQKLLQTYEEAAKVKGTYSAITKEMKENKISLEGLSEAIRTIGKNVETMAVEISNSLEKMDVSESFTQLQEGINTLSTSYKEFHSGLVEYTNGVSQIASSYNEMHNGIVELSNGTNELANGVSQLHNGTDELYQSTNNLPDQMQEEIDEMIAEYDKSDFEAISYTSSKNNEKINTVQFVLKTESIDLEEPEETEEPKEEKQSFWDRLKNLFS